ncbi:MAG: amidohydrolase family protein [Ruminococcaceae bacterium]|nr:amidohydrolase family protein [Oscillospiraceae bacterium]
MALFEMKDVDKKRYASTINHFLPDSIFDVHTHVYQEKPPAAGETRTVTWPSLVARENPIEDLEETARLMFPGKRYVPLMFGSPSQNVDLQKANAYVAQVSRETTYPALMLAHPDMSAEQLASGIREGGFLGIKVYLTFAPKDIPVNEIRIFDFLPHAHLEVCDQLGLIVMLHIPRSLRLRDPLNIAQMLEIEKKYKNIHLIIAHVGRAYCQSDVGDAFERLAKTERMVFDFSANTNDWVFEKLIQAVGTDRILFGSDLPISRMRMRRIERDSIYVNLVPRGLYGDVSQDKNMDELDAPESDKLSFFMYEIIDAFRLAAQRTGLTDSAIEKVFWSNATQIIEQVRGGLV